MASDSSNYSCRVPDDLAQEVDQKRERAHPETGEAIKKSKAVERGLELWVNRPTWRDHAHAAAVHLSILAVVAFVSGETTEVLTIHEAAMLSWVLLSVAAGTLAMSEFVGVVRELHIDVRRLLARFRRSEE